MARYDRIGHGCASTRRPDPRLRALIDRELGDAKTPRRASVSCVASPPPRSWSSPSRPRSRSRIAATSRASSAPPPRP